MRSFDLADFADRPPTFGRSVTADELWANFERFITTVLPVAEEAGVRLALHPDDPPVTRAAGVERIFNGIEGFKRATELIAPSPNFGLNFCMGSWSEQGPGLALQAMRYFGERRKIFYVHFRDVKGHVPRFDECFLGEGNIDPAEAIEILTAVGFHGFMQDDHVPMVMGETALGRSWSTGYIHGLLRGMRVDR